MLKIITASLLALITFQSVASTKTLLCNYCDTQQMKSRAMSQATDGGKVDMIDAINGEAKSFMVFREPDMIIIQPTTTTSTAKEAAIASKSIYDTLDNTVKDGVKWETIAPYINDPRINNAYDLAGSYSYRYTVEQALIAQLDNMVGGELVSVVGSAGLAFANSLIASEVQFNLIFPDGSTFSFAVKGVTYDFFTKKAKLKIIAVKSSGRDGDIRIPQEEGFQNYFERHGHTIEELYDLLDYLRANDVTVSIAKNVGGGRPVVVICDVMKNCVAMPE